MMEKIRQIASIAWKGSANAFRLYPNSTHTFSDYWESSKNQFNEFDLILMSEKKPLYGTNKFDELLTYIATEVPKKNRNMLVSLLTETIEELKRELNKK